jgi:MerR family redox-sensitive transcriptional activator SoxR
MLTIGQVASRTGLRASAIRYYESRGLLPQPARVGGKRVYHDSVVERLAVIRLAKAAGFDLDEILAAVSHTGEDRPAARWRTLAAAKQLEVDAERQRLKLTKYVLMRMNGCSCSSLVDCGRTFLDAVSKRPPHPPLALTVRRKLAAKRLRRRQ